VARLLVLGFRRPPRLRTIARTDIPEALYEYRVLEKQLVFQVVQCLLFTIAQHRDNLLRAQAVANPGWVKGAEPSKNLICFPDTGTGSLGGAPALLRSDSIVVGI
jgi:hypothetical protein